MRLRAILALAVAMTGLALAGPVATAAAAPVAYPVTICPTLSVSTTTPLVGEKITVSGVHFDPNAHIRLELHTTVYVLATVVSDAAGSFTTQVTMPAGVTGHHLILAIGGGFVSTHCTGDPVQVTIQTGVQSTAAGGTGSSGGGTAFTGLDILALIVAAAALLGIGLLLNRGGKRTGAAHRV